MKPPKKWVIDPTGKWNMKQGQWGRWVSKDIPRADRVGPEAIGTELFVHPMKTTWKPRTLRGTTANNHDGTNTDRPVKTGKPSRRQLDRMAK